MNNLGLFPQPWLLGHVKPVRAALLLLIAWGGSQSKVLDVLAPICLYVALADALHFMLLRLCWITERYFSHKEYILIASHGFTLGALAVYLLVGGAATLATTFFLLGEENSLPLGNYTRYACYFSVISVTSALLAKHIAERIEPRHRSIKNA